MREISRSIIAVALLVGCSSTGVTSPDLGAVSTDMTVGPPSVCGHPGDNAVNDLGVGSYCQQISDCFPNGKAKLCSQAGDPTTFICTFICTNQPGECGANAACVCQDPSMTLCGCTPVSCLADAGTK